LGYGSQHSWNVKLSANREKPRFAIIGFTLNGELITNSESHPYDNLNVDFSKNQYAHLYEMYTRFVGMTTTLKNNISLDNLQSQNLLNSGWSSGDEISTGPHFNFSVPLKNELGFAEDYKQVLLNCKHELVLMLTKNLGDVFEQTRNEQTFKLEMTNITWKIAHVTPSDFAKIKMYDFIKSGVNLPIAFRS